MKNQEINQFGFHENTKTESAYNLDFQKIVNQEFIKACEKYSDLINLVDSRYQAPESTLTNSSEQLRLFKEHNSQVLKLCIQRGLEKGLSQQEIDQLEVAAILHDIAKADKPLGNKVEINNYVLAAHGEMAAEQLPNILNNHPETLTKILGNNYSKEDCSRVINQIQNALRCHMGPHPGFMDFILDSVNQRLSELGEPLLEHQPPKSGDKISEILLAADMYSLADRKGREKVLAIRLAVPIFQKQDEILCAKYNKLGINLSMGEAALLSGFDSADQAKDTIKDADDRIWIDQTIENSKNGDYKYGDEVVNYQQAVAKRNNYLLSCQKIEQKSTQAA
jgi:hypothetical protein